MDERLVHIKEKLEIEGYRLTNQRIEIMKFFLSHKGHYKPEQIYQQLKRKEISIATVYRIIDLFIKFDFIQEVTIGADRYYELKIFSKKIVHGHFSCTNCNKIIDIDDKTVKTMAFSMISHTERDQEIAIDQISIVMQGLCDECKRLF